MAADDFDASLEKLKQAVTPGGTAPEPTPAASSAPSAGDGTTTPEGAISYGWRIGKHTLGVGAHTLIEGLNDFWSVGPNLTENAQARLRGVAKIIGGALTMFPGAPISFLTGGGGQALEKAAPDLANTMVVQPGNAEGIHRVLDPFNAIAMGLETPESKAAMSPEQQQAFAQRAAGYGQGITFREAFETALGIALPIAAAHQMKGAGAAAGEAAKPGEAAPKPPAAEAAKPAPAETPSGETPKVPGPEVTAEQAKAFVDRVSAEPPPPVPPPGTEGPRVFGINWQRLGQEESIKRVILDVNKTLSEQGRTVATEGARPVEAGGPGAKTIAGMTDAAKTMGVTLDEVMEFPKIPKRVDFSNQDAFVAGANAVHEVVAHSLRDMARMAEAGDQAAIHDLPTAIALFNETTLKTKDIGTNLAQSLNARKAGNVAPISGVSGTNMLEFQDQVAKIAALKDIDKVPAMIRIIKGPSKVARFLGGLGDIAARGKDMTWELFVNDLLGPSTIGVKAAGDAYQYVNTGLTRGLARMNQTVGIATLGKDITLGKDPTMMAPGEGSAFMAAGAKEVVPAAGRTIVRTLPDTVIDGLARAEVIPEATMSAMRTLREMPKEFGYDRNPAISTDSYVRNPVTGEVKAVPGPFADVPVVDPLINAAGALIRTPTTGIGMITDVASAVSAKGEIAAMAKRIAYNEGREGAAFGKRVADVQQNWQKMPEVVAAVEQRVAANTFTTKPGIVGQQALGALNAAHLRSQVPFFVIPWNLVKTATHEIFPFNVPSMVFGEIKSQLQAGGPARMEALATLEKGAAVAATVAYLTNQGFISGPGPSDPKLRKERELAGKPPNAFLIPGQDPISFSRLHPAGLEIGLIAGLAERGVFKEGAPNALRPVLDMIGMTSQATEAWAQIPWSEDNLQYASQLGVLHAAVWGRMVSEASYYKGVRDLMEAIRNPEKSLKKEATDIAGGMFAPATMRQINQAYFDRTMRETRDYQDRWLAAFPGYSQDLAPHRDRVTGDEMEYPAGWGPDLLQPFKVFSPAKVIEASRGARVYQMLTDNQITLRDVPHTIDAGPREDSLVPNRGATGQGDVVQAMPLTDPQRDKWFKRWTQSRDLGVAGYEGLNLREAMERLMLNPRFTTASPQFKGDLVHVLDGQYGEHARLRVLNEDQSLKAAVDARKLDALKRKFLPTTDPRSPLYPRASGGANFGPGLTLPGAR